MFASRTVLRRTLLTGARVRASKALTTTTTPSAAFTTPISISARKALYPALARRSFSSTKIMAEEGVHNLTTKADWDKILKEEEKLIVLDCYATWCGPCKMIAPQIVKYAKTYTNARFYKLDVDDVPDVAQDLGIRAMPTFLLFKDGNKVGEVVGANPKAIEAAIKSNLPAEEGSA